MEVSFFYMPNLTEAESHIQLDEASANHCTRVLRKKQGDPVILTNGKGLRMEAIIETIERKNCTVLVQSSQTKPVPAPEIAIGISFTKSNSRIEWFLEKATEIGISHIFPLVCKRTEKTNYKFPRLQNILVSAMLQSQQHYLPVLHEPIPFQALIRTDTFSSYFIAHCEKEDKKLLKNAITPGEGTLILIGPEGDFTPEEISLAKEHLFTPVSLGDHRLRTETAGLVACTLINAANQR